MKNLVQVSLISGKYPNPQSFSLSMRIFSIEEFKSTEGFFKYIFFYFGTILDVQETVKLVPRLPCIPYTQFSPSVTSFISMVLMLLNKVPGLLEPPWFTH